MSRSPDNRNGDGERRHLSDPTHPTPPQQLPREPTVFENQIAALESLNAAGSAGPITHLIVGSPGSGKSATALHWANVEADRFVHGRLYLDLRGHDPEIALNPREALRILLTGVGADPAALPDDLAQRAALWRSKTFHLRLLVLLDNAADAEQVSDLLCTGPGTVTVITSRNTLVDLTFLPGTHVTPIELLTPDYAASLLRRLIEPRRGPVDTADLAELAELCGYLQLALRVAAQRLAKSPLLTVADFNSELRERARILDPVRAVFDSSYHGLRPATARLFRLVGIAPGSDIALDALRVLADASAAEAREQVEELLNSHLLAHGRPGRYVMHDLLHAYAAELVTAHRYLDEADTARLRLGTWYAQAATAAARALGSESQTEAETTMTSSFTAPAARQWYTIEEPNLAIMVNALISRGLNQAALDLSTCAVELYAFYNTTAWPDVAQIGLTLARATGDTLRQAWFLESLGKASLQAGDPERSLIDHEAALSLRRQAGDESAQARSLNAIGLVRWRMGSFDQAEALFSQCRELAAKHGEDGFETFAIMNLALVALSRARQKEPYERKLLYEKAVSFLDVALARLGRDRPQFYCAHVLSDRAEALAGLDRLDDAQADAREAVQMARTIDSPLVLITALLASAEVESKRGYIPGTQAALIEALDLSRDIGDTARADEVRARLELAGWEPGT